MSKKTIIYTRYRKRRLNASGTMTYPAITLLIVKTTPTIIVMEIAKAKVMTVKELITKSRITLSTTSVMTIATMTTMTIKTQEQVHTTMKLYRRSQTPRARSRRRKCE